MTQTTLLVLARSAGLFARAPAFSHPSVPAVVRMGIACALAFAVAPSVGAARPLGAGAFTLAVGTEFALGTAIGFGASLLYDGAYFAGRAIDDYLGVRGSVPGASVTNAQAFGRLWSYAFLAAFVLLDGWIPVVRAFGESFAHVAAGGICDPAAWLRYALAIPATIVRASFVVAAPAIAVAASLQLALAAVGRVVPRLGTFALSFPAVFAAALIVTVTTLPIVARLGGAPWLVLPWDALR